MFVLLPDFPLSAVVSLCPHLPFIHPMSVCPIDILYFPIFHHSVPPYTDSVAQYSYGTNAVTCSPLLRHIKVLPQNLFSLSLSPSSSRFRAVDLHSSFCSSLLFSLSLSLSLFLFLFLFPPSAPSFLFPILEPTPLLPQPCVYFHCAYRGSLTFLLQSNLILLLVRVQFKPSFSSQKTQSTLFPLLATAPISARKTLLPLCHAVTVAPTHPSYPPTSSAKQQPLPLFLRSPRSSDKIGHLKTF
ncbi:hypothetical protein BC939DRAFT_27811 [Gamsiella multidivaricata]|uniref:uncharacterized protein n=1 Tax=Gamsiella multidivaricata TaxID=101098 RepID=UPI0022207B03|nr:uncharacterized protein BC939DRAFT_27811 [Gamsiella multidivaricata]KAI7829474.1 hypothetical protein BC939DRAFT_27811 [Gamsiella multidivaricata]